MTEKKKDKNGDRTLDNAAIGAGNIETVSRYGAANAEWVKAYSGVDNETGQVFTRGLKKISQYSEGNDPATRDQVIKAQAGFSAEVAKVAEDNARNIINKSDIRTEMTENNPARRQMNDNKQDMVSDHIQTSNGVEVPGSASQMKMVQDCEGLLTKIARGDGSGKNQDLSRYMENAHIDIPKEHYQASLDFCEAQAKSLRQQANHVRQNGKHELAARFEQEAKNFDALKDKLRPSFTTAEAVAFRENPLLETTKRVAKISHEAGLEGAKFGAIIGGTISAGKNIVAYMQGDKDLREALCDTGIETGKSAAVGYATGFVGSALKGSMQQSSRGVVRQLAKTSFPALVVSTTLALGTSINRYAQGEIDGTQFLEEIGEKGSGMLASGLMATVGQIALPIPVVGGLVGGMVGYTISSMFYQSSLEAFKEAKESEERYQITKARCEEARRIMLIHQTEMQVLFDAYLADTNTQLSGCFACMDDATDSGDMDALAAAANRLGGLLGSTLRFETMLEFEDFMSSDETLIL